MAVFAKKKSLGKSLPEVRCEAQNGRVGGLREYSGAQGSAGLLCICIGPVARKAEHRRNIGEVLPTA
jgi:hypothetical protein